MAYIVMAAVDGVHRDDVAGSRADDARGIARGMTAHRCSTAATRDRTHVLIPSWLRWIWRAIGGQATSDP